MYDFKDSLKWNITVFTNYTNLITFFFYLITKKPTKTINSSINTYFLINFLSLQNKVNFKDIYYINNKQKIFYKHFLIVIKLKINGIHFNSYKY